MARTGKIARLPRPLRSQLNSRLHDGQEAKTILQWLNSLPEVTQLLAQHFDGHPVTEQNLSDWRQGGYEEWRLHETILAHSAELAANRRDLEAAAPGQSPADYLAAALTFRYAAILAAQGPELNPTALTQLRALGGLCQAVVKLRRGDHNAARLKIETERWDIEREKLRADAMEETQRKIRAALTARITSLMKLPEWRDKLGGSPNAVRMAFVLREMEMCADPAHYRSDIIGNPQWDRYVEELRKNAPPKKTEMEAALDTYRQMETGLGLRRAGKKAPHTRPRAKAGRRPRKTVARRPRRRPGRRATSPPPVGPSAQVHEIQAPSPIIPMPPILPIPVPAPPLSPPDSPAPAAPLTVAPEPPIQPNRV